MPFKSHVVSGIFVLIWLGFCIPHVTAQVCLHDGDVNQDGNLTPADALLAFQHFLGLANPPLDDCQQVRANVDDPEATGITPADALCIFQDFLGLQSCLAIPYDDFAMDLIDRDKWTNVEFVRQISNGQLELALTAVDSTVSNTMLFTDPGAITTMQADVTITAVDNTADGRPRARVAGFFYNDGTGSGAPGDRTGDVYADVGIRHNGTELRGTIIVNRCTNADCTTNMNLLFDDTFVPTPVVLGETHTLSLAWDGATQFTFGFDGATPVVFDTAAEAPNMGPPQTNSPRFIGLRIAGTISDEISIAGTVDNVMVNGALYDDFESESGILDPSKWTNLDLVRRVHDGHLELALHRAGANGSNSLPLPNPSTVNSIQADVTVTDFANSGASPRARLAGRFYNDGTAGADGVGDIFASMEIRPSGTELIAAFLVLRCLDAGCTSTNTIVFDGATFGAVAVSLGETHTLSLAWNGTTQQFTFGFDNATPVVFDPTTADDPAPVAGPAEMPSKFIGTRISAISNADEAGFIAANFDNVFVE